MRVELTVRKFDGTLQKYKIVKTAEPYERYGTGGEYSRGGYLVTSNGDYIENFSDFDTVLGFFVGLRVTLIGLRYLD